MRALFLSSVVLAVAIIGANATFGGKKNKGGSDSYGAPQQDSYGAPSKPSYNNNKPSYNNNDGGKKGGFDFGAIIQKKLEFKKGKFF